MSFNSPEHKDCTFAPVQNYKWNNNNLLNCIFAPDELRFCTRILKYRTFAPFENRTFAPLTIFILLFCTRTLTDIAFLHPTRIFKSHIYTLESQLICTFAPDFLKASTFAPVRLHFCTR